MEINFWLIKVSKNNDNFRIFSNKLDYDNPKNNFRASSIKTIKLSNKLPLNFNKFFEKILFEFNIDPENTTKNNNVNYKPNNHNSKKLLI